MNAPRRGGLGGALGLGCSAAGAVSGRCNGVMNWGGWRRYALLGAAVVAVLGVFAVFYGWLPWWIDGARLRALSPKDQAGILSSDRGDVLKMVAGAGAIVALIYTARRHALDRKAHDLDRQAQELSRQVFALSEQGQVTDRYTKAITQLSSDKESERIGGIYALERIMSDSPRDHPTVVAVMAAFVRQHATLPDEMTTENFAEINGFVTTLANVRPAADVQAAMTVLARRPHWDEPFALDLRRVVLPGLELPPGARLENANFDGAVLAHAQLDGANLAGARLGDSNLSHAFLTGARLTGAWLPGAELNDVRLGDADLTGAYLVEASLRAAFLRRAILVQTDLSETDLKGADLHNATLTGTDVSGAALTAIDFTHADLRAVVMLTAAQLADAIVAPSTMLPEDLEKDAWVLARIEACKGWIGYGSRPAPTPDPSEASP